MPRKNKAPKASPGVSVTCPGHSGPCPTCAGLSVEITLHPSPPANQSTHPSKEPQ